MRIGISSRRRFDSIVVVALIFAAAFLMQTTAWSQANSATFYVSVVDPTGAAVPGATVALTEQNTQATITKTAGSNGELAFPFIPVGTYTLRIDAKGFKAYASSGIAFAAGQQARQTFRALRPLSIRYPHNSFRTIASRTPKSFPCRTVILLGC
jgi:hypothetical protein